jgi:hypothetical protein
MWRQNVPDRGRGCIAAKGGSQQRRGHSLFGPRDARPVRKRSNRREEKRSSSACSDAVLRTVRWPMVRACSRRACPRPVAWNPAAEPASPAERAAPRSSRPLAQRTVMVCRLCPGRSPIRPEVVCSGSATSARPGRCNRCRGRDHARLAGRPPDVWRGHAGSASVPADPSTAGCVDGSAHVPGGLVLVMTGRLLTGGLSDRLRLARAISGKAARSGVRRSSGRLFDCGSPSDAWVRRPRARRCCWT